jgi:hypothetical protein
MAKTCAHEDAIRDVTPSARGFVGAFTALPHLRPRQFILE